MADTLQFELVSPEKLLLSEAVGMVVVPGTEGKELAPGTLNAILKKAGLK